VNIRKTTLYIGSFFLNAVWLFVYIAIYSKKDDYDALQPWLCFQQSPAKDYPKAINSTKKWIIFVLRILTRGQISA
jgi:hypothetical protein